MSTTSRAVPVQTDGPARASGPAPADVVAAVDAVGARVHALLDGLRDVLADRFAGGSPSHSGLAIEDDVARLLRLPDLPLVGAGFVAAPGALADVPYWLEWFSTDPDAAAPAIERLDVQTDPDADDFRDYTALPWFAGPRDDGTPHLTGPYVDYLCTDEYTLTFTQPVVAGDRFVGVVGADLFVRGLEAFVLPLMARLAQPSTLVNAVGRVVTSSGNGWVTGDLVRDVPVATWWREGVTGGGSSGGGAWRLHRCVTVPLGLLVTTR